MKNIKVTLLHHTPLHIASDGARTCWSSQDKSDTCRHGNYKEPSTEFGVYECLDCGSTDTETIEIGLKDLALIDRVGNQFHHASILEHISFNFFIDGISRACLQELARHRLSSFSVKSSRYTLKELKDETSFKTQIFPENIEEYCFIYERSKAEKYLVFTDLELVNNASIEALERLRSIISQHVSNDKAKYCMPEAYRTQLTWSINLRSLQNFLLLRTDKKALPEIQHLARLIYEALPEEAKYLVKHCVKEKETL